MSELPPPNGIVTLMTDFGTVDGYVAAMKGALLTVHPAVTLVDVTHHIPSQDVTEAAFQLSTVWTAFPEGTVHVAVVDPGVGTKRRAVAVCAGGQYFLAPDNGLLTLVVANVAATAAIVLDRPAFYRSDVSSTFHGRDIFAPLAGHLSLGKHVMTELGSRIPADSLVRLAWSPVAHGRSGVSAPVVSIDRFGNCRTLITRRDIRGELSNVHVRCGPVTVRGVHRTYSDVDIGNTLALFGSHGGLELAVRGGNAAAAWNIKRGDDVVVLIDTPARAAR